MEQTHPSRHAAAGLLLGLATLLTGCAKATTARGHHLEDPSRLHLQAGQAPMHWSDLVGRAAASDVVVLGEQHDDAVGHAVQLALIKALLERCPDMAVALEMLERDEQGLVSDYRDSIIDRHRFIELTRSGAWAGKGSWDAWYGPVVDAAIAANVPVVAANAPRRYVTLARSDGFEAVAALDQHRAELVAVPDPPLESGYRDRFMDLIANHDGESTVPDDVAQAFFRAQQIWDATMARSVLESLASGHRPVVLLVGRFHSDHDGGTVELIRRGAPDATVLTVSLEPDADIESADLQRADIVVFTAP